MVNLPLAAKKITQKTLTITKTSTQIFLSEFAFLLRRLIFTPHHLTGMMDGVKLKLTDEDTAYLEELYIPHALVGVMAQNKPATKDIKQVWTR